MKIAIVHSYYSSDQPSGENVVVDLQTEALRSAGHEVEVFSSRSDSDAVTPLQLARAATRVATGHGRNPSQAIERFSPDVLHVHNLFPNIAQRWLEDWPGPMVATIHNYRSVCAAGSLFRAGAGCESCLTRNTQEAIRHRCYKNSRIATLPLALATRSRGSHNAVLRRANRLLFLSERARDKLSAAYDGDISSRSIVLPNFVDAPLPARRRASGSGRWIYCGRLAPEKGVLDLVSAWDNSTALDIVGDGPDKNEISKAAALKNVRVLGKVSVSEAARLIGDAKGLVFPSRWEEPAPAMSYLQALAAGIPTITLPNNAVSDDIAEWRTGIVCDTLSELNQVAQGEIDSVQFGANAVRRYEEAFSRTAWTGRATRLYSEMTS